MDFVGIIYCWINIITYISYVGQTRSCETNKFTTDHNTLLYHRFKGHCSDSDGKCKTYFHRALKHYGLDNFIPIIISVHTAKTEDELVKILDEEEIKNICQLNTLAPNGYNLTTGGSSPIFHDWTKAKMSKKKQSFLESEDGKLWVTSVSEAKKKFYKTEKGKENAKKHGEIISAKYKANPELIEQIRNSVISKNKTPEGKERLSKHSEWMKTFMMSPEGITFKNHLSLCAKKRWENAEYREKHITDGKRRFEGEEGIKRKEVLSIKATERMKDSKVIELASEKTKAYFDRKGRKEYKCDLCGIVKIRDKTAYTRHCETKIHKNIAGGISKDEAIKKVHEETSVKISKSNIKWAEEHENSRKGATHTSEAKEKNRLAHLGKTLSDSTRTKLSETIKTQYEKGERKSGLAKLTDEQVLYIRANKGIIKQKDLSEELKVSVQTISAIQNNKVYVHVKDTI
jgi:hypothetical protein